MFKDFKPGDMVAGVINPNYHMDNRPYFDAIEMKGGGDAVSAARAVLQTGEFDFAWNMQVEDEILQRLEKGGKGRVVHLAGGDIEHIQLNTTDPWTEVDGERSEPQDQASDAVAIRRCARRSSLLVDKDSVEKYIYGRTGIATANFVNNPESFRSKTTKFEFNVDKADRHPREGGLEEGRATASARRTARSSSSSTRPRSTSRARRPRRSSSRPARRPASTSRSRR